MRPLPLVSIFLLAVATAQAGSNAKAFTKQFRSLDSNKDDSLSTEELGKALSAKLTRNGSLTATQEAMFAWFDEDASEGIDLGEWIEGRTSDGSSSPDFSEDVVDELDTNGDGKLKWKEFHRVITPYVSSKTAKSWFNSISSGSSTDSSTSNGSSSVSISNSYMGGTLSLGGWSGGSFNLGNTFSGSTTISDGSLSGSGSFGVMVESYNGTTIQTFALDLTFDATSVTTSEIAGSGGVAGVDFDFVNVTVGTLTNDGSLVILGFGGYDINAQTGNYNLFDFLVSTGDFDVVTVGGTPLTYNGETDSWSATAGGASYNFSEGTGVLSVVTE